jgi:hypothetical protein
MGEERNVYSLLVAKPEEKRPLGRPRHRWVDNIKMDMGEIEWGGVDWIGLAQDGENWRALVNAVLKFGFHKMLINYGVATKLMGCRVMLSSRVS